ncbi:hypothetical protein CUS95_00555 [Enterococcus faecium]|nr:hypothetical protein CUS95_00555 [Enterococcus faecium]PQF21361.1 hypothetical protein CUS93_11430 [Enterococcus faecium]PQG67043.1 hypothetical protein CUS28_01135 [Enterococcus faecium]
MNTVFQEVVSLPFISESQGTISKNSFSCLLNILTYDRGVDRRTPFIRKKRTVTRLLSQSLYL